MLRFWSRSRSLPVEGEIQAKWDYAGSDRRVSLSGRITIDSSPDLHELLLENIQDSSCGALTIDFDGVTYMDTSGLAMLAELLRLAREGGKSFRIQRLRGRPRFLLEAAQLGRLFNLDVTSEDAR